MSSFTVNTPALAAAALTINANAASVGNAHSAAPRLSIRRAGAAGK